MCWFGSLARCQSLPCLETEVKQALNRILWGLLGRGEVIWVSNHVGNGDAMTWELQQLEGCTGGTEDMLAEFLIEPLATDMQRLNHFQLINHTLRH